MKISPSPLQIATGIQIAFLLWVGMGLWWSIRKLFNMPIPNGVELAYLISGVIFIIVVKIIMKKTWG